MRRSPPTPPVQGDVVTWEVPVKRIVEFPLDGGGSVFIESDEPELAGTVRVGRADGVPEKAKQTFEQSLETVRTVAGALLAKVDELSDRPDELEIEFGIKLSGEIGAILASAKAEANYAVTMTWRRAEV
jgi:hypothetical protein